MNANKLFLGTLTLAAGLAALSACGDSDDTTADGGATDGSTAGDSGVIMDASGPQCEAAAAGAGACNNAGDLALLGGTFTYVAGNVPNLCFGDLAATCARSECVTAPDRTVCMTDCLTREAATVSAGCRSAYVDSVVCSANNCLAQCLSATNPACTPCRCGMNTAMQDCVSEFVTAAGLESTTTCP